MRGYFRGRALREVLVSTEKKTVAGGRGRERAVLRCLMRPSLKLNLASHPGSGQMKGRGAEVWVIALCWVRWREGMREKKLEFCVGIFEAGI